MSSVAQIRDALVTTLAGVTGVAKVYRSVGESVAVLPAIIITPSTPTDYDVTMGRGVDTWSFDLIVLVPASDLDVGTRTMDGYITGAGGSSIREYVFTHRTLGLGDVDAHVAELTAYNLKYDVCAEQHIGAVLRCVIHTTGTG